MDKSEYLRLLCEAYINDTTKFRVSDPERPKARGYTTQTLPSTPPTEGEDLESIVRRILPKPIAVSVRLTGSRSAAQDPQKTFGTWPHLISHTNVQLWVGEMVGGEITAVRQQPVHNNWQLCVCVRNSQTENQQRWYSCVVRCYLTIYQRARRWNHPDTSWQSLYQQHLNLNKVDLVDLLKSHQRPSSMGNCTNRSTESPWAHHLGHCSPMFSWDPLKKLLSVKAKCLNSTRWWFYVDDTFTNMLDTTSAASFLQVLNNCHSSVNFTTETEINGVLLFLGMYCLNRASQIETKVYVRPTNTGLLLHNHSHVDMRYKRGLLKTMLDRAYRLSSCWSYFSVECDRLFCLNIRNVLSLVPSGILLLQRRKTSHRNLSPQRALQFV